MGFTLLPDDKPSAGGFRLLPEISPQESSRMALEGYGPVDKALINVGAGMDSAWQGVKQFFGAGMDDAAVAEKRAMDRALAENTTGGSALQFAGEVAPMMAIPGSGFVRGGSMLLRGAPVAARLGTGAAVADAAIGGALSGALQMTSGDESKALNAVVGAIGGAAISGLVASGKVVKDLLTAGGAKSKAAAELVRLAGGEDAADAVLTKLRTNSPGAITENIPLSVAEITQNPALGRAERTARAKFTEDWAPFRADQARERFASLQKATANDLSGATAAREAATTSLRDDALKAAETADFSSPVSAAATWLLEGSAGANPSIKTIARYVLSETGENATPERLYTVRKVLLDKLHGKAQIGDELSAATRQARRETMTMVNAIDDALDGASGGKWKPYLDEYASKSGEVNSAQALDLIRKSFDKMNAPQFGDVPAVTSHRLGTAMEKYGQNSFGDRLTPNARAGLEELRGNISLTDGLEKLLKMTGTGGGSNTAMDLTGIAASTAQGKLSSLIPMLGKFLDRADTMTQAAVSDALRNPDMFISVVSKKLAQRQPLSASEDAVLALLRSLGAGAPLALIEQQ